MVLPHPPCGERKQREPEQQVEISPEDWTCHRGAGLQQVMVVVPVNAHVKETQDVAEKHWQQRPQRFQAVTMRYLHLQNHDRDDDRNYSIAERFQSPFIHLSSGVLLEVSAAAVIKQASDLQPRQVLRRSHGLQPNSLHLSDFTFHIHAVSLEWICCRALQTRCPCTR